MKALKDIILEKLVINKNFKLKERTPEIEKKKHVRYQQIYVKKQYLKELH